MKIFLGKGFKKSYRRLREKEKEKFKERLGLFMNNHFDPTLNNHALSGKYNHYRSINITGDLRALYYSSNSTAVFVVIDTHSNLYE